MDHSRNEARIVQDVRGSSCVTSKQGDIKNTNEVLLKGHRRMWRDLAKDAATKLSRIIIITSTGNTLNT